MRFRDWLFEKVYLPRSKAFAEMRVKSMVRRNDEAYERLMKEYGKLVKELEEANKK